ncbi:unnamed protein product [Blepharisma stoltei]|uniref:UBX domain-containing protein n=1 Tax=Blepharisma stoltei TaxID=1481888 RepID=A0AAU9J314_9CILI|nr:unnamed protein product [Blepharisma stoltei]
MNSAGLTNDQSEALVNFQAITECWDNSIAMQIMRKHNWDVTAASNEYFAFFSAEAQMQDRNNYDRPEPRQEPPIINQNQNQAQQAAPQTESYWSIKSWITWGAKGIYSGASNILWNIYTFVKPPVIQEAESASARAFVTSLQNLGIHEIPPFSIRNLSEVLQDGQSINRPVLVYINSRDVPAGYLREVICHEVSIALIAESYLIWGVDENSQDGINAIRQLQVTALPTLAVVQGRNNGRPQVLDRLEGCASFDTYLEFLERNSVQNVAGVDPDLHQERLIREQQDRELEEAERITRERYRAEELKRAQIKKEQEEEMRKQQEEEQRRKQKEESIGEEPNPGPDIALISFRLPDGKKIERRFYKEKQIETLYDFIETLSLRNFEIVTNFPSKVLDQKQITLEAAGLFPKSIVYVRDTS